MAPPANASSANAKTLRIRFPMSGVHPTASPCARARSRSRSIYLLCKEEPTLTLRRVIAALVMGAAMVLSPRRGGGGGARAAERPPRANGLDGLGFGQWADPHPTMTNSEGKGQIMNRLWKVCLVALFASLNGVVLRGRSPCQHFLRQARPPVAAEVNDNFSAIVTGLTPRSTLRHRQPIPGSGRRNLTPAAVGGIPRAVPLRSPGITTGYANTASGIQAMLHTTIGFVNNCRWARKR